MAALDWFEGFMHVKRASLLKVEIRLLRFGDYGTSFLSAEEVSGCLDFALCVEPRCLGS